MKIKKLFNTYKLKYWITENMGYYLEQYLHFYHFDASTK